ncbi:ATP-dependent RNA helicase DDX51 [Hetaerina americana]|uniref:ATP-dependent RNA helicase DDX51 n=1 Tax=Hetaerina americana TaxID=62018 RepID=UPI003A7F60A3
MELFVINRYWGENNNGQNETTEPKLKMKKLLQRIEERKNLKEHHKHDAEIKEELSPDVKIKRVEESSKPPKKKVKKRKLSEHVIDNESKIKCKRESDDEESGALSSPENSEVNEACERDEEQLVDSHFESQTDCVIDYSVNEIGQESLNDEKSFGKMRRNNVSSVENFTVIGTESFKGLVKASQKLPPWLQNPVAIPVDLENFKDPLSNYEGMLDQKLIKTLRKNGITHFFPVQAKVIPWLLENNLRCRYHWPRDLCVSAPTGSGKTLAFVLPVVQALMDRLIPEIRVLVVLPVVELAKQVGSVFRQYCAGTGLQVTVAVGGGKSFAAEHSLLVNQGELLGCQTDIFVTTPGRLVAHLRADSKLSNDSTLMSSATGKISLKQLQFLVIDEADRVAEGGQNDWLSHLVHHLEHNGRLVTRSLPPSVSTFRNSLLNPCKPPQKLLFSATLSHDPEKLSALSLFQPKLFLSVSTKSEEGDKSATSDQQLSYTTPKELSEEYVVVDNGESEKPLVLLWILQQRMVLYSNTPRVLIFVGTRKTSMRLALLLSLVTWDGNMSTITSSHLSSDLSVQSREKVLQDFIKGRTNILVCSDALARGVDVPSVDLVISYDPPRFAKNHIHRIGRTGRAGHLGCAITILTPNQLTPFACMVSGGPAMGDRKKIEISEDSLSDLNEKFVAALASMEDILQNEHQNITETKKKRKRKTKKSHPNEDSKKK